MAKKLQDFNKFIGSDAERLALVTTGFKAGVIFEVTDGAGKIADVYKYDGATWNKELLGGKDFATQTTLATLLADNTFTLRLGEVQATPTANTVLARLKAVETELTSVKSTLLADGTFTVRLGEVQATPTANTVLARLKALETELTDIKSTSGIKKITDTVNTKEQPSSVLYDGTKADVGTVAAAIGASQAVSGLLVQASPSNSVSVFVGNATSQSTELQAGTSITIPVSNVNLVYAKTTSSTATINYIGRS